MLKLEYYCALGAYIRRRAQTRLLLHFVSLYWKVCSNYTSALCEPISEGVLKLDNYCALRAYIGRYAQTRLLLRFVSLYQKMQCFRMMALAFYCLTSRLVK